MEKNYDVIIIGAGAAGLMCAIEAGKRSRQILLIDHSAKIGEKIRISGGSRCNFTNMHASNDDYLSQNQHFYKSAFARYTPNDFIDLVEEYKIAYHEKKLGQLFCDKSSQEIISMLLQECEAYGVEIRINCKVNKICQGNNKTEEKRETNNHSSYILESNQGNFSCESLVIATGGLSIPKIGATDFGYKVAQQFGLQVTETRPGLVPFTFTGKEQKIFEKLSGASVDTITSYNGKSFRENILFTHKGLSGPAILQISSYWKPGDEIKINLLPDIDMKESLLAAQENETERKKELKTWLKQSLPKNFLDVFCEEYISSKAIKQYNHKEIDELANTLHNWLLKPSGTEGYAKAEVTLGGVDTNELSSKTMEAKKSKNLYFIGEVVDVTGHLGGYNFQWAWASGYVAGQYC